MRYMARELLESAHRAPAADIFSLGLMTLEIATDAPLPSGGPAWHALRDAQVPPLAAPPARRRGAAPEPRARSAALDAAVRAMVAREPAARPSARDIAGCAHAQRAARTHDPTLAGAGSAPSEEPAWPLG